MAVMVEPELMAARRAFPKAQQLLAGVPESRLGRRVDVGWHGTEADPETGACAVVRTGAGFDALIGQVVRLETLQGRSVFAYVLGARDVPADISVTRRTFFPALGVLSRESLSCAVEVVL